MQWGLEEVESCKIAATLQQMTVIYELLVKSCIYNDTMYFLYKYNINDYTIL